MMRIATILALPALILLGVAAALPDRASLGSITVSDIKSDLSFLASDEMRGRAVGTPFNALTARYLAHRFEKMGLQPAGSDGFFQPFEIVRAQLGQDNRLETASSSRFRNVAKEEFFPSPFSANGAAAGPVAFAGYGISAPELGYDDYAQLDARGKIVVVLDHEPGEFDRDSPFDGLVMTDHGRDFRKIFNAQRHGAAGVIIVEDQANHSRSGSFARTARRIWPSNARRPRYRLKSWVERIQIPALYLSADGADSLFPGDDALEKLQNQIDQRMQPGSFPMPGVRARLRAAVERESIEARNVLAAQPGSDPTGEWVVVGAHFDHVGAEGEKIFNGADDDASGTVGLLEVAQAFASSRQDHRRSVLFAAWNAEETGLLGSYYFVDNPTIPIDRVAAMLQMDMIGRDEQVDDPQHFRFRGLEKQSAEQNRNSVNILGYSRSPDLQEWATLANRAVGLELRFRYDNQELGLLRRSDNWPFLNHGVPALFFHTGLHPDYHQPTDTVDKINFDKMAKVIQLVFLTSWKAADDPQRPRFTRNRSIQ